MLILIGHQLFINIIIQPSTTYLAFKVSDFDGYFQIIIKVGILDVVDPLDEMAVFFVV